jgi:soluble lytic murein transglycosylase
VAVELLALGLREEALEELRDLARSPRVRVSAVAVAQLAAFAEDAVLPFRMARDHLSPTRVAIRWAYPEPHRDVLVPGARGFGVDPALLLAVMRRESGFRPEVRSSAGAEGLLQLRPPTADRLSALLGASGGLGVRLAEPGVGIVIGAHYLGLLQSRFADPIVAVAAYNAGPQPVAEWTRARTGMPLDAWVESIPYRETREYVKFVGANWDTYRALAGEPPPPVDPRRTVAPPAAGVAF